MPLQAGGGVVESMFVQCLTGGDVVDNRVIKLMCSVNKGNFFIDKNKRQNIIFYYTTLTYRTLNSLFR